jgi:hypothetical protein
MVCLFLYKVTNFNDLSIKKLKLKVKMYYNEFKSKLNLISEKILSKLSVLYFNKSLNTFE